MISGMSDASQVASSSHVSSGGLRQLGYVRHTEVKLDNDFSILGAAIDGQANVGPRASNQHRGGTSANGSGIRTKISTVRSKAGIPNFDGLSIGIGGEVIGGGNSFVSNNVNREGSKLISGSTARLKTTRPRPASHIPNLEGLSIGDSGGTQVVSGGGSFLTLDMSTNVNREGSKLISGSTARLKTTRPRPASHIPNLEGIISTVSNNVASSEQHDSLDHHLDLNSSPRTRDDVPLNSPPMPPPCALSPLHTVAPPISPPRPTLIPSSLRPHSPIDIDESLVSTDRLKKESRRAEALAAMRTRKIEVCAYMLFFIFDTAAVLIVKFHTQLHS
jgi:hypothetical protein